MESFVIMGFGRSGSNLLCDLLSSHPQIICHGELFHPHFAQLSRKLGGKVESKPMEFLAKNRFSRPESFLRGVNKLGDPNWLTGFKFHHYQGHEVEQFLINNRKIKKIFLIRKNFLKRFLSEKLSRANRQYMNRVDMDESVYKETQLTIDMDEFIRSYQYTISYHQSLCEKTRDQTCYTIHYEDFENEFEGLGGLLSFLNVERDVKLETFFQRMNLKSPRECILNYDELEQNARHCFYLPNEFFF